MAVMFGDKEPSTFYLGDNDVDALYLGDDLVWTSSIIPKEYREVKYLYTERSGSFHLGTDVLHETDWAFEIDCEFTEGQMFGCNLGYDWGINIQNGNYWAKLYTGTSAVNTRIPAGERCIFYISKKDNILEIRPYNEEYSVFTITDGDVTKIETPRQPSVGSSWSSYSNEVDYQLGVGKIYHFKAWYKDRNHSEQEFVLRKDCYPCYHKTDRETGLYDMIEDSFWRNYYRNSTKMLYPGEKLPTPKTAEDLPEGYTPLLYLQSSGIQYIDLGANSAGPLEGAMIKCKNTHTGNYSVFGKYQRLNLTGSSGNDTFYANGSYNATVRNNISLSSVYDFSYRAAAVKTFDGSTIYQSPIAPDTSSYWNTTMYLFGRNRDNGLNDAGGTVRIYNFFIALLGTNANGNKTYIPLYDMVPCLRDSDGKPGMYDFVSGNFFVNNGSNEFTYAYDESVPDEYVALEYLESTAMQDISIPTPESITNGRYDIKFSLTWTKDDTWIAGVKSADDSYIRGLGVYNGALYSPTQDTTYSDSSTKEGTVIDGSFPFDTTVDDSITLFGINNEGVSSNRAHCRIYRVVLKNADLSNMITNILLPVSRKEDGIVGFYDVLKKHFYASESETAFILPYANELGDEYSSPDYIRSISYTTSIAPYIITDWKPAGKCGVITDGSMTSRERHIFGACHVSPDGYELVMRGQYIGYNDAYRFHYKGSQSTSGDTRELGTMGRALFKITTDGKLFKDNSLIITFTPEDMSGEHSMFLFAGNDGNEEQKIDGTLGSGSAYIYYFRGYELNEATGIDELKCYFIPAVRTSDGKVGLYDLVTKQFYTNAGNQDPAYDLTTT